MKECLMTLFFLTFKFFEHLWPRTSILKNKNKLMS